MMLLHSPVFDAKKSFRSGESGEDRKPASDRKTEGDSDETGERSVRMPKRRSRRSAYNAKRMSTVTTQTQGTRFRRCSTGDQVPYQTQGDLDEDNAWGSGDNQRFSHDELLADDECSDFEPEQEERLTSNFARVCSFGSQMDTASSTKRSAESIFHSTKSPQDLAASVMAISGAVADTHLTSPLTPLTPPRNNINFCGKRSYLKINGTPPNPGSLVSASSSSLLGSPYSSGYRLSAKRTCTSANSSAPVVYRSTTDNRCKRRIYSTLDEPAQLKLDAAMNAVNCCPGFADIGIGEDAATGSNMDASPSFQ